MLSLPRGTLEQANAPEASCDAMLGLDILHRVPALGATALPFLPTVGSISVDDLQKRMERAGLEIEEVFKPVPGFALVVARKSGLRLRTRTPHRPRASG
ncbi:MAG TPA: hypothetical protein EYG46_03145 [Myxococcales bacterium]|nr:hypothetical protein [Myxococcales bacterium]